MRQTVPTTVFSGFLGSGKTTIISHLIDTLQSEKQQVVYIKNEIGNENVDAELMKGKNIETKELLNGCICCTLVGPFVNAIAEIVASFRPQRIIIEASGAADPAAIALMIDSHPQLHRDGVISIIDVVNFEGYKDLSQTAKNQTTFTDLIVFNKVELVSNQTIEAVVGYVRELNDYSPIVEAPHGILDPQVVFGLSEDQLNHLSELLRRSGYSDEDAAHTHHPHEHHLEQDGLETFVLSVPEIEQDSLRSFLDSTPGSVYRIKGFYYTGEKTFLINKVGKRLTFQELDASPQTPVGESTLVFIGFRILRLKDSLQQQLHLLSSSPRH